MGKLLKLPERGRIPGARIERTEPAQIVLFTGIRYERQVPNAPDKPLGTASGTKRRGG